MANIMLEILDGFSSKWALMHQHSKSPFSASDFEIILNWSIKMNIIGIST